MQKSRAKSRVEPKLRIYSTLSRRLESLPNKSKPLLIYVCGVTVYDYSHIGHARTIVVFDVLRRYLMRKGYRLSFVQNFTDVDDKIINKAKELGISAREVADRFTKQYYEDFDGLNVLRADVHPKATEHIQDIQKLIQILLNRGFAYQTPSGVYFHISKFNGYGKLSQKTTSELIVGARVEVDPHKKDPLDFALWKFSDEEPNWESPWERGRPGWHIECSAMSLKHLRETLDIHGGGQDLIFPHHENEIAQSESCTNKPFVKIWMHVGLVNIAGERMAKSLRNYIPIREALPRWGPNILRLYSVMAHYRSPINFTETSTEKAEEMWRLIENAAAELRSATGNDRSIVRRAEQAARRAHNEFEGAMSRDLNTPVALSALMRLVRFVNSAAANGKLSSMAAKAVRPTFENILHVFGFQVPSVAPKEREEIEKLLQRRNELRRDRQYAEADRIRALLSDRGIEIVDYPNRTVWRKTVIVRASSS